MSNKQDRSYARTAQDIERKYSFGNTFAEMLGLINENRDKVDSVESGLKDEIRKSETLLRRDTDELVAQAKSTVIRELGESINDVDEKVSELTKEVSLKLDSNAVNIAVKEEISKGVNKVITENGYRFDTNGLKISQSGSGINNTLDHTGMYVRNGTDDVLVANDDGVDAKDLHAKTYLIVGEGEGRSRFEDYETDRTGCFWVGG